MRTTIDIPEHILIEAKHLAAKQRKPLTALVAESLRRYLAECRRQRPARRAELRVNDTARARAGVDLTDTSSLWGVDDSL